MITIKIRPWEVIGGVNHVGTSWRVATDQTMTNILDEVINDVNNVTIYNSPVVQPLNVTYYVSVQRHFLDASNIASTTPWTDAKPIVNSEYESSLISETDIFVDKPHIFLDETVIKDTDSLTFDINTSSFRSLGDGHGSTTYLIYDSNDNLIYHKIDDTVNKTSLTITKTDIDLISRTKITIKVMHNTPTGIESGIGTKTVLLNYSNIEIVSRLNRVIPYTDYTLQLAKINASKPLNLTRITVTDLTEANEIWSIPVTGEDLTYTIPKRVFSTNSNYLLILSTTDNTKAVTLKKVIYTAPSLEGYLTQSDYVYANELTYLREELLNLLITNTSYHTLTNGEVVAIPLNSKTVTKYTTDLNDKKLLTGTPIAGMEILRPDDTNVYMEFRSDSRFLIDCLDANGVPNFLLYKYDWYRNTAVLEKNVSRVDETLSMGNNNGIVRIDEFNYYYIPIHSNIINKLDITTMTITKVYDIPSTTTNNMLMDIGSGKLAIFTGDKDILIYDIDRNDVYPGLTLYDSFMSRDLKVIKLINNNSLIVKKDIQTGDDDSILVYDYIDSKLTELTLDFGGTGEVYQSSIILSTGECLLFNNNISYDKYFIYK